ncbi:hypothetical protein SDC9_203301 [bioreactor metagenome]|uniref:Uncharacterized protein n=1 Tax=bioreactor metagenome TaxID=1076179 RepID=A0A645IWU7_9ZZZZ
MNQTGRFHAADKDQGTNNDPKYMAKGIPRTMPKFLGQFCRAHTGHGKRTKYPNNHCMGNRKLAKSRDNFHAAEHQDYNRNQRYKRFENIDLKGLGMDFHFRRQLITLMLVTQTGNGP